MAAQTITLHITGMHCDGCTKAVKGAISSVAGVQNCDVNLEENTATVTYDPNTASVDTMIAEVEDYGYGAKV